MNTIKKGTHPKLLILSGMHGDEHEIIPFVSSSVTSSFDALPDFMYIPEVSPSAVSQKTRLNAYGHDINRCFFEPIKDPEALSICNQIAHLKNVISLDFHEDNCQTDKFYFYDTQEMHINTIHLFRQRIKECDIGLYHGIDDPDDPSLGCTVDNGYVSHGHEKDAHESGFLTKWMAHNGITSRAFTFEIPMKCDIAKKQALIQIIFSFFIDANFMIQ